MRSSWLLACGLVLVSAGCEVEPDDLDDDFVATVEDLAGGLIDFGDGGASGDVSVVTDEGRNLAVDLDVQGLEPSGTYVLALHGLEEFDASLCPGLEEADVDGDGELSLGEIEAFAGEQIYVLDTDIGADTAGGLRERWDFLLTEEEFDAFSPLEDRVLVLYHGGVDDPIPVGCFDLSTIQEIQPISGPPNSIESVPVDVNGATYWPRFPEYVDYSLER